LKSLVNLIIILFSIATLVSCAGGKEGAAPSAPVVDTVPAVTDAGWEYEMNYSEKIVSSNSWEGTLDTQDVSEQLITANGWTVEVSND
jgi:hypothetical protein